MMNFNQGQLFTLTTDDSKTLTYRIQTITEDGRLLVHSSLLEESYFITAKAFGDFLRFIGATLPEELPQHVTYQKQNETWYIVYNHDVLLGDLSFIYAGGLYDKDCWVYSPGDPRQERKNFATIEEAKAYIEGKAEDEPAKYKIWLTNYNRYFGPDDDYSSFNDALEMGKMSGANFQIRLGDMICATWVPVGGLEFTKEYKNWYQENEKLSDEPAKYRIYYINHQYYHADSYQYINQAIEAGKETGMEFRVELGKMVCCAWDAITGLRFFSEYQRYTQDQATRLSQVEGSYP